MERKRGNERILIRNLKNKIIRLADSKCQLRNCSRWRERDRHTQEEGKREEREGGERNIQKETGGAKVMETPLSFPPAGRNTIFLILRSNTSTGKIFPFPTGGKQSCQVRRVNPHRGHIRACVHAYMHICTLTHSLPGWEMLPLSQP